MKRLVIAGLLAVCTLSPALADPAGISATDGFARATLPGAPVGGAYVTLRNTGTDDRLVAASSPAAGRMEIHDMRMDGDMMRMVPLPGGLPIPAGDTVRLEPMGKHLMLMDLKGPLTEGATVDVTLTFEHAAPMSLKLPVAAINASHGH